MNFKMGPLANISETEIEPGAIYFAKDNDKLYGELYYDDSEGARIKIAPRISQASFNKESILTLLKEDSTYIDVNVPAASTESDGFVTTGEIQHFAGIKTFPAINIRKFNSEVETAWMLTAGNAYDSSNNFIENVSVIVSNFTQYIITNSNLVGDNSILANCKNFFADLDKFVNEEASSSNGLVLNGDRGILFFDTPNGQSPGVAIRNSTIFCSNLGCEQNPINQAYIDIIYGSLEGNADTATVLQTPRKINDTDFDGSADIVTDKWGCSRTFNINNEAHDSETIINGSEDYVLYIPTELTGFSKINSTNLYGTNLGSSDEQWTNLHIKNPHIYGNYNYSHLLNSLADQNYTLFLPNSSGELIYHFKDEQVGSESIPIYVDSSGKVCQCSSIDVTHGGTGLNFINLGNLMIGAGNNNTINTLAPGSKGQILVSNGYNAMPTYITPSFSWTGETSLDLNINGVVAATAVLPEATNEHPGIVTTVNQQFSGLKIFDNIIVNDILSAWNVEIESNVFIQNDITLGGRIKSSHLSSQIIMNDNQIEINTPSLYLNGDIIKVSSNNYGEHLPDTGLEEGRIFFLLTPEQ